MTIHGFCQSLLKRFPLEAGVAPHFELLDPRSTADLLREAQSEVLASSRSDIRAALGRLAVLLGEGTLAEGLNALREDRLRLGAALAHHDGEVERLVAAVCAALGVPVGTTPSRCATPRRTTRRSINQACPRPPARSPAAPTRAWNPLRPSPTGSPPRRRSARALGPPTNACF